MLVEKKVRKTWSTLAELGSVVSRGMINLIKSHPAERWVKAGNVISEDLSNELLELRRENEELRIKMKKDVMSKPEGTDGLCQENIIEISIPYRSIN